MVDNPYRMGQGGHVHVHLPLHLPCAFGSMVVAHLRTRSCCDAVSPQYR